MNKYQGRLSDSNVTVNNQYLPLYTNIANHSPAGFSWGYYGSGPSQLALAIMINEFGDNLDLHPVSYMELKDHLIAKLPEDKDFSITSQDINEIIKKIKRKE